MSEAIYKVVVLGEGRVGKTSISLKYVRNEFDQNQKTTINASYLEKRVQLDNGQKVKLTIWDTAGQEEFNSVAPIYYREAVGAIVCYDITSSQSLTKARKWVTELEQNVPKGIVLTIAGNKSDLQSSRKVSKGEAQGLAKASNAKHFIVSAKNGNNIPEMFQDLAKRINSKNAQTKNMGSRRKLQVQTERVSKGKESKKKCCS